MLTEKDIAQIKKRGGDPNIVESQLAFFKSGFPFLKIDRAAVVGDGIIALDREKAAEWAALYDKTVGGLTIEKFVPASGAATRMFKELYEYVGESKSSDTVEKVLDGLPNFAFYDDLAELGVEQLKDPKEVIRMIIGGSPDADEPAEKGLGYGAKPKGLIKFHRYKAGGKNVSRTAMEEHLVEVALYGGNPAKIHFTVSPEHQEGFETLVSEKIKSYADKYGVEYTISYSVQDPVTDTIAVNLDNTPFREGQKADGKLVFRPGGHGALINNLDRIDADLIFIKTVDNVVPDHLKGDTTLYKKALAAITLELQQRIFSYLKAIDSGKNKGNEAFESELKQFIEERLCYRFPENARPTIEEMRRVLDRPLRVCGMVKNEGEPGGGPFWVVKDGDDEAGKTGEQSLQIAESSQVGPDQKNLMENATHFNPVDLVCAVRNFLGKKFDLTQYIDKKTGFISEKSKDGHSLKAQELPGLWNGAMAHWNTIFVEVPISTFAPVKTVVDLLRPQHQ